MVDWDGAQAGRRTWFYIWENFRLRGLDPKNLYMPNAQAEPRGCLAQKVPVRSTEIALSVTSVRIGSSAWLGSVVLGFLKKTEAESLLVDWVLMVRFSLFRAPSASR